MNVGRLIDLKLKMINISDLKAETISSAFSNLRYFNIFVTKGSLYAFQRNGEIVSRKF